jgi:hypothetical protein
MICDEIVCDRQNSQLQEAAFFGTGPSGAEFVHPSQNAFHLAGVS